MADKGLKSNVVGLFGGTMLGISSVAPAYALTATLGLLAAAVAAKTPVVIIAGFLPMFFAAYAYREFNTGHARRGHLVHLDVQGVRSLHRLSGWMGGGGRVRHRALQPRGCRRPIPLPVHRQRGELGDDQRSVGEQADQRSDVLAFIAIATYVAYRGIDTTEHVQLVLVIFQLVMLLVFSVLAIAKSGGSEFGEPFSWSWFSPAGLTLSAFIAGLSGSIFAFWGWDTALTVNEESKNSDTTPGRAALLCVLSILLTYLLVAVATQMFAGLGETGIGLGNPETSDNVFGTLAIPVLGQPLDLALYLAVLASSAASLITTILPTTRTLLAMGAYKAMPPAFAKLHPVHKTPAFATLIAGIGAAVFYTVLTFLSESVLTDTIYSLGIMICFYYGLTAFGCIWFFRHTLFDNAFNFVFKFLFPLLGGLGLFLVFVITLRDSASPDYGSGASIGGVGLVLILGLGLILLGVVVMLIMRARQPEFFRGETIIHESAHAMRPHEHLVQ